MAESNGVSPPDIDALSIVVLGASGDLAKKKTFPAIFTLFASGFLPEDVRIYGFARSEMTDDALRDRIKGFLKGHDDRKAAFLERVTYLHGSYTEAAGFQRLQGVLDKREGELSGGAAIGRMYYLALPPSVYAPVVKGLKEHADMQASNPKSWLRVVVEKPFGKDLCSSEALAEDIAKYYPEEQIFRIDHYLGKELTQNLTVLRFANAMFSPSWNRDHIANVQICFKEPFGTEGRGGYFDEFGIIRDVIQNHLLQVMALTAMEKPVTLNSEDMRDEKVKVLRACRAVRLDEVVLGQYTGGAGMEGYLEDKGVPKDSTTPTFALCVLHIENDRWQGVPFILKAGKALNERKVEIRVQYKPPVQMQGGTVSLDAFRNELVMRLQPDESIYMKVAVKKPGLEMTPIMSELDLTYKHRYQEAVIPEAYERLLLDAIHGNQQHFVRRDELRAAWSIFTPLLHQLDEQHIKPLPYVAGTRGPKESDEMVARNGFKKNAGYSWSQAPKSKV